MSALIHTMDDGPAPTTKHCNGCDTTRSLKFFCKHRQRKSGYQSWCKFCAAAWIKAYRAKKKAAQAATGG